MMLCNPSDKISKLRTHLSTDVVLPPGAAHREFRFALHSEVHETTRINQSFVPANSMALICTGVSF